MVEFAIMLIIIMGLLSGMIYMFRLLLFQYWAQQEARILGFEQDWVQKMHYAVSGTSPNQIVENGTQLRRPEIVTGLSGGKNMGVDGSVTDLLPTAFSKLLPGVVDSGEPDVMVARNEMESIQRATWTEDEDGGFLPTAFARDDVQRRIYRGSSPRVKPHVRSGPGTTERSLREKISVVLEQAEFGPRLCETFATVAERYGVNPAQAGLSDPLCAKKMEKGFSAHLARNLDLPQIYRDYSFALEQGQESGEALHDVMNHAVADQFYSFFDVAVRTAASIAPGLVIAGRVSVATSVANEQFTKMLQDMRYLGSSATLLLLAEKFAEISLQNPSSTDSAAAKTFEDSVTDLLHVDASDVLPVVGNGFFLSPLYLPIPPTFGAAAGGMMSGAMRNVLSEESELENDLIDNSNYTIRVDYNATNGLFNAARRRFKTSNIVLTSRFYVVTQPWHITRQVDGNGVYRELGDETADIDDDNEEGVLRRRTLAFWLFPSKPGALLEPISAIAGFDALDSIVSVLGTIDGFIAQIKSFLADNPIFELLDILSEIPGFGSFVPTVPKWPAVRPMAYPGSVELENDKLMGGSGRDFQKYVDEQREFNPPPKPKYHDD